MDVSSHVRKMLDSQKRTIQLEIKYGNPDHLNLNQILKLAMETCQIDMLNTAAKRAIEIAAGANSEQEFDRNERKCLTSCIESATGFILEMYSSSQVFEENSQLECSTTDVHQYRLYKDFEQCVRDLITKAGRASNSKGFKSLQGIAKRLTISKLIDTSTSQVLTHTTKVSNDMEITETNHSIDPITKGTLVRPVRNVICNHIYGYQSVMDSLSINRKLRCPMIGCSNRDFIVSAHLVEI